MCTIVTVVSRSGLDHVRNMTDETPELNLTGQLLLAMPSMGDPRFAFTVILICSHSAEGAMGLIVNKPAHDMEFNDLLKQMKIAPLKTAPKVPVQIGGPVEAGRGFVLHSNEYVADDSTLHFGDDYGMTVTIDILEQLARGTGPERSILCMGYAGWGPCQLEDELQQNGWLTCDATPELVFGTDHDGKWQAALQSMGIDPLMLSSAGGQA
jgi:putative transcriptional regulator